MRWVWLVLLTIPLPLQAAESATVVSVTQICRGETPDGGVIGRTIDKLFGSVEGMVGAALGARIGSEMGDRSLRRVATVVGATYGNQLGNKVAKKRRQQNVAPCNEISVYERTQAGYLVTLDYQGTRFKELMDDKPVVGTQLPIKISVAR